jgi:hypothetical protein
MKFNKFKKHCDSKLSNVQFEKSADGEKTNRGCAEPDFWRPTYKWYAKVFGIIFGVLIAAFFILNILLKPYMRVIDPDITPWLHSEQK